MGNWWALKWARRFFNKLNRGEILPDDQVQIAGVHRASLEYWLSTASTPHVVNRELNGRTATLFTDATLTGWGAVLVYDNDRLLVSGGRFTSHQSDGDICRKEAWAIDNALAAFAAPLRAIGRIHMFVDNTSVVAAMRRGMPRADSLVEPVRNAWQKLIGSRVSLYIEYIRTDMNPADPVSREKYVSIEQAKMAIGTHQNQRKGAGIGSRFVAGSHS